MIARVFPTKTSHTPNDDLSFFDHPGLFDFNRGITEVHISVVFKWDLPKAELLKQSWSAIAPVKIGGPATGQKAEQFNPGMYLKKGITFTSRGCPNKCWFCSVWKRDGNIRELPITEGNIIQDDNFLATSRQHQEKVFEMLKNQKEIEFTGGLDPKFFTEWHVQELKKLRIKQMFFAYDTPDDLQYLQKAGLLLKKYGYNRHKLRCYALCGYPEDTIYIAKIRMIEIVKIGFFPMAMRWRDEEGVYYNDSNDWKKFARNWIRPATISMQIKEIS